MAKPTWQEMEKWWDGLQKTLDEANAGIDLNKPEDLFRIRVTTINEIERDNTATVTAYFPFADDAHKNAEPNSLSDRELISIQQPGKPNREKLAELYTAAKEGRLFFKSLSESGMLNRQLIADKDGNPGVLPDSYNFKGDILFISQNHEMPLKPEKKSAGLGTRLAALFGSKQAKEACKQIDEDNAEQQRTYEKHMENWKRVQKMDPVLVRQIENSLYSTLNYFELPMDEEQKASEQRLQTFGDKAHKQPMVDALTEMTNELAARNAEKLSGMMKQSTAVTPEAEELIAQICYQKMLAAHMKDEFGKGTLTEQKIAAYTKEAVVGSPNYRKQYEKTVGSDRFRQAIKKLSPEDVKAFAAHPTEAAEAVYKKCSLLVKNSIIEDSRKSLSDVKVQAETKDFTATSKRPQLEQPAKQAPDGARL